MRRAAAFTMLELLLVLAVLGAVSALAAVRLTTMRGGQGLERAARLVCEQALRAQQLAAQQGAIVRLRLDPEARSAAVHLVAGAAATAPGDGQGAAFDLFDGADAMTLELQRDDGAAQPAGAIDLLFLPDHRCDSPGLIVIGVGGRSAAVRIAPGAVPPAIVEAP